MKPLDFDALERELEADELRLVDTLATRRRERRHGLTTTDLRKDFPGYSKLIAQVRNRGFGIRTKRWYGNDSMYELREVPEWATGSAPSPSTDSAGSPPPPSREVPDGAEPVASFLAGFQPELPEPIAAAEPEEPALFKLRVVPLNPACADLDPDDKPHLEAVA